MLNTIQICGDVVPTYDGFNNSINTQNMNFKNLTMSDLLGFMMYFRFLSILLWFI